MPYASQTVRAFTPEVRAYLATHFRLTAPPISPPQSFLAALLDHHHEQTDLVVALLRSPRPDCVRAAEALGGAPVRRLPPQRTPNSALPLPTQNTAPPVGDARRIRRAAPNPFPPTKGYNAAPVRSHHWFAQCAPGTPLAVLLARGVPRRFLNDARARGLVEF